MLPTVPRRLLPFLLGTSVAGVLATLPIHVLAMVDRDGPWALLSFVTFPGVFVVHVAAVLEATRLNRHPGGLPVPRLDIDRVLRGLPRGVRAGATWAGACLALATVLATAAGSASGDGVPPWVSAVPLTFFAFGALVLWSGLRVPSSA